MKKSRGDFLLSNSVTTQLLLNDHFKGRFSARRISQAYHQIAQIKNVTLPIIIN